jgi:DNA-binding NarL/FixJ family response regulator
VSVVASSATCLEGIEAARTIRAEHTEIGVVVLPQHTDESHARALFNDGSNAGIEQALFLSESTVEKHVNAIFTKLGIPAASRSAT